MNCGARYLEILRSRRNAARKDQAKVTAESLTMSGVERWEDVKRKLPERVRELSSCLKRRDKEKEKKRGEIVEDGEGDDDPATLTTGFKRIGPEFFHFLTAEGKHRGMPTTWAGLCSFHL